MRTLWIAGCGSEIAKALIEHWQSPNQGQGQGKSQHQTVRVISSGRGPDSAASVHCQTDTREPHSVSELQAFIRREGTPDAVIVCNGILHNPQNGPEKSLQELGADWLQHSLQSNVISHIHTAQALAPFIKRDSQLRWLSLSAMVGSISDNQLGGWYSYRMSKAALNMFIKNLSIEWQRKAPQCLVAAVHPGTTNTSLSAPFQQNIAAGKLYTPQQTAQRISDVLLNLQPEQHGHLLHWDGRVLPY
ncbi:SDR family NAD(P)-dependent oxidoreductase [Thalassolituus pacificus]|uniref:SDR family NAD(P)-dependent oxidoreductase n=1 Tax=Thalassolituus pacificus TaxID=2975440 RepID=A0A9X2WFV8_9GAMM|nr:SDR family NAD(P)-dependent oxidoreductase [Thalassolituus pacificus]MCT7359519.1 SDR family NAD(P)-dependent oxidoreductase [Thalassolituus pacificus]